MMLVYNKETGQLMFWGFIKDAIFSSEYFVDLCVRQTDTTPLVTKFRF